MKTSSPILILKLTLFYGNPDCVESTKVANTAALHFQKWFRIGIEAHQYIIVVENDFLKGSNRPENKDSVTNTRATNLSEIIGRQCESHKI